MSPLTTRAFAVLGVEVAAPPAEPVVETEELEPPDAADDGDPAPEDSEGAADPDTEALADPVVTNGRVDDANPCAAAPDVEVAKPEGVETGASFDADTVVAAPDWVVEPDALTDVTVAAFNVMYWGLYVAVPL